MFISLLHQYLGVSLCPSYKPIYPATLQLQKAAVLAKADCGNAFYLYLLCGYEPQGAPWAPFSLGVE